jgi:hypothetical protein
MTQPTLPLGKLNAVNPSTSRMPGAGLVDGSGVDDAFDCSVPVLFRGPASPPQLHSRNQDNPSTGDEGDQIDAPWRYDNGVQSLLRSPPSIDDHAEHHQHRLQPASG